MSPGRISIKFFVHFNGIFKHGWHSAAQETGIRVQRLQKRANEMKWMQWKNFARDERGNVALMVSLSLPALVLMVGGGVDYANTLQRKAQLQNAVDSALLATHLHYQKNPKLSDADLQTYFDRHLKASMPSKLRSVLSITQEQVEMDRKNDTLRAWVKADSRTNFLRLAAINKINISTFAEVQASPSYTEVALVLDTTGSMRGSKIAELKKAAKNFLNTIHAKLGGDPNAFKVAVVPFSMHVNVGKQYRNAPWISVPPDMAFRTRGHHRRGGGQFTIKWEGCVGSRPYPLNIRDEQYGTRVPGVMQHPRNTYYPANSVWGWYWNEWNNCPTSLIPLTPLKTGKSKLVSKIDSLQAGGWTYIPGGLVWGWRVLSPEAPFTEGASWTEVKKKNVRKIIVLMTDGANTRAPDRRRGRSYADHQSGHWWYADSLLTELCDNIKARNPQTGKPYADIITVTFDVRSTRIKNLMKKCSSIGSYDARSGQLVKVFDTIAKRLVELHLSK